MIQLYLRLSSKEEENINKLNEKYGFEKPAYPFKFLITIYTALSRVLMGVKETGKNTKDEF